MIKFKLMPLMILGAVMGALSVGGAPAQAQTTNPIYDQFNNAKVAYVGNEQQFSAAIDLLTDLPGSQAPSIIRFIKPGIYSLGEVNNVVSGISYSIEGPGSFYMDPTGATIPTNGGSDRASQYGVTIRGGIDPVAVDSGTSAGSDFYRFITVRSGQTINLSGLTLMDFGRYMGDGPAWTNSSHHSSAWGGTILNQGTMTLTNVTILNSRVIGQQSHIKADTASPPKYTADSDRVGGSALGGAIYNSGSLTMRGVTIFNCSAQTLAFDDGTAALGGAVYSTGTLDVANCTFDNNGVYGDREFDGYTNNYNDNYHGGSPFALAANTHGAYLIAGGRLVGGGAIAIDGGSANIQNITVTANKAYGGLAQTASDGVYGGGIYWKSGFSNPYNSLFADNEMHLFDTDTFTPTDTSENRRVAGVRPNFQYSYPTVYKDQFQAVSGLNVSNPIGPNVANGSSGDGSGATDTGMYFWGYKGPHNLAYGGKRLNVNGSDIDYGSYLGAYFTDLQDNGGQTLTRAPKSVDQNVLPIPNPNSVPESVYNSYYLLSPVDNGSIPHTGTTSAEIASYLGGVDQRGAKRVVHGRNPDSIDTSAGSIVVDVGAVEAEYEPVTHALKKVGGNTKPFVERDWDSGIADADYDWDADGDGVTEGDGKPNHDVEVTTVQIRDADEYGQATSHEVEVTIDFPDGKILTDFSQYSGITVVSIDENKHKVVIRGTISDINAALAQGLLLYRDDAQVDYPPNFSITVNDLGNYGYGGEEIYSDVTTHELIDPVFNPAIYIQPVNHKPNVLAPGTQYVKKNADNTEFNNLVFSRNNGNAIYVSDPDINAPITNPSTNTLPAGYDRSGLHMQVTLEVSDGSLSLGNASAVTIVSSDSQNGGTKVTIEGSPTALNLALEGLSYRPNPGTTSDKLNILVNDLGNYGQGGPLTATGHVNIKVNESGQSDGSGSDGDDSATGTIRWEASDAVLNGNTVEITYTLTNLSNTDITNIVASGSIAGGVYFNTDADGGISFAPSAGGNAGITYDYNSPELQRRIDPSKNGLSVTWALVDDSGNPYVLRQGRNVFLRVTIPADTSAAGHQATGAWRVNFTTIDDDSNATKPGPTPPRTVQ